MKITCKYCGVVSKPHNCPHGKRKTDNNRIDKQIYKTIEWQDKRENILEDYNHMCLWSLYIDGEIVGADEVHHIIELLEDDTRAFDDENLIPLEFYKHKYIHKLYKKDKNKIQELLWKMIECYRCGDKTLGKFKDSIPPMLRDF